MVDTSFGKDCDSCKAKFVYYNDNLHLIANCRDCELDICKDCRAVTKHEMWSEADGDHNDILSCGIEEEKEG